MKRKKDVSFHTLVKIFLREYNIPTKKDFDRLMDRMDRLEQMIQKTASLNYQQRASAKREGPPTASDVVIEVIREAENGIGFREIKDLTGFEEKKLRNIIFRLNNLEKIQRISRGVYIVPETGPEAAFEPGATPDSE